MHTKLGATSILSLKSASICSTTSQEQQVRKLRMMETSSLMFLELVASMPLLRMCVYIYIYICTSGLFIEFTRKLLKMLKTLQNSDGSDPNKCIHADKSKYYCFLFLFFKCARGIIQHPSPLLRSSSGSDKFDI